MRHVKEILFTLFLIVILLIIWRAIGVFFLAFASILLAILLHAIGSWTQKIIKLPYLVSLLIALFCIAGFLLLIFWLYTPLITQQFQLLLDQLPAATQEIQKTLSPHLESLKKELSNETLFHQVVSIFSSTVGSVISFLIFLIVGFYLAIMPGRYLIGVLYPLPEKNKARVRDVLTLMAHALRYWLVGKVVAMFVIGSLTYIGLWFLDISLAFILGLLAGLLAFIPYVGAVVAAIPAILIAYTVSPLTALYVLVLFLVVHFLEGYLITPFIEQRTVAIPPALTIMGQILLYVLVGGIGLVLASPLIVVIMAVIVNFKSHKKTA